MTAISQLRSLVEWWVRTYHCDIPRLKISSRTAEAILNEMGIEDVEARKLCLRQMKAGNAGFYGIQIFTY
jgi:hypothetical protein